MAEPNQPSEIAREALRIHAELAAQRLAPRQRERRRLRRLVATHG